MNEDIRNEWIEALTSGEYEQGQKQLRTNDNTYCCLGVLCDLAVKKGIAQWGKREGNSDWAVAPIDEEIETASDFGFGLLPRFIMAWSGITSDDGALSLDDGFNGPSRVSLTELNDVRKYNFNKIAEIIKEKL